MVDQPPSDQPRPVPDPASQPPYAVPGQPPYVVPPVAASAPEGWAAGAYPSAPGYWQSWPGQGFVDPFDPLVTPPGAGVSGWFARATGVARRSWRSLLLITLATQAVPGAVTGLAVLAATPAARSASTGGPTAAAQAGPMLGELLTFMGVVSVLAVLASLLQSVGWAAGTWALTREALAEPVRVAAALRYGVRRALGLWGWTLLAGLIIMVGACACVLPGIYAAFALSLTGPIFLFERVNPIGRSFRIVHSRLAMVLGRVGLVAAVVIGGSLAVGVLENVGLLAVGANAGLSVGAGVVTVLAALLNLPLYAAQLVGLVITYAEQRGWEGPVNSAQLAGELG
jgi:hypothetical protein